jgi:hypothetical protein
MRVVTTSYYQVMVKGLSSQGPRTAIVVDLMLTTVHEVAAISAGARLRGCQLTPTSSKSAHWQHQYLVQALQNNGQQCGLCYSFRRGWWMAVLLHWKDQRGQ